jgi:SulP family sulfate permease
VGFTTGIGTVIGLLQLRDLLGLQLEPHGPEFLDYLAALGRGLGTARGAEMLTGAATLLAVLAWQRLRSRVPSHLVGLAVGTAVALGLAALDPAQTVATIGSRFEWVADGVRGHGVPPFAPHWVWPWQLVDATGAPAGLSIELLKSLIGPASAIAMLGALESLLCATVADGMTGERHDPNDELIGQGIGNIVVPFLGGIPATAALARTAANIRAGARSPLASVVHALFLLLALIVLAPLLAWLPMASMAALLLVVAWNMSELHHFRRVLRVAPRGDAATLVTCFMLTVLVNMEVAVAVGMGLAALVFIRRTIELTGARIIERHAHEHTADLPSEVVVYDVNGPLFFGAAQKALNGLARLRGEVRVVILDLSDVTMLDMTAIVALESILEDMRERGILLLVCGLAPPMVLRLRRTGMRKRIGVVEFARNMQDAAALARKRL